MAAPKQLGLFQQPLVILIINQLIHLVIPLIYNLEPKLRQELVRVLDNNLDHISRVRELLDFSLTNSPRQSFPEVRQFILKLPKQLRIFQFGNLKMKCHTETAIQWVDIIITLNLMLILALVLSLKPKLELKSDKL